MAIKERSTKTHPKRQERGPQLSREMALHRLDGIDEYACYYCLVI